MYHYGLKHKSSLNPALIKGLAGLVLGFGVVTQGWACACGCGVFDVGLPGLPVSGMNDQVSLQYSFMNQNWNHSGASGQVGALNPDKQIGTNFYTLYGQHMFNDNWGVEAMLPYWTRTFTTDTSGVPGQVNPSPSIRSANISSLSDLRVMGMYTGFSKDKSSGLTFGLKLPTGPVNPAPLIDRDTAPGTGTTDLLLGYYSMGNFSANWGWFSQGTWRHALDHYQGYKPGDSLNTVAGVTWNAIEASTHVIPSMQVNSLWRARYQWGGDALYGNLNSGYANIFLAPGALIDLSRHWQANTSIYLPLYRYANGDQLVPHWMVNAGITYLF
jgi:hypothetical protein